MAKRSEVMWAIRGVYGLYIGTWFTRAEAITAHVEMSLQKDWRACRRNGDRAVKVRVTVIPQKARA